MMELWQEFADFVDTHLGIPQTALPNILWTLLTLAAYFVIRYVATRIATRRIQDMGKRYITTKTITYALGFLTAIALVRIWLGSVAGIAAYLGILSAGIAIALQDPLSNLAAWFYIVSRKPFVVGDRIEVGEHAGDVIDISLFQFSLVEIGKWVDADQSTGRIIHVPNGWVFKKTTSNYTQAFNFIWNELPVTITFESNWEKAKEILTRIANQHSAIKSEHAARQVRSAAQKFMIFFQHLTPIVWTSLADNGVTLTIRYLCEPRRRRSSSAKMWEEILRAFSKCTDIDFAYPTWRMFNNLTEAKHKQEAAVQGEDADPSDSHDQAGSR